MSKIMDSVTVAIVGAGVGGITAAITLQKKLGFYDYTIYEKAEDVGGTWRQNTYPGCACDCPVHWYSLSSEPNPNWEWLYAPRDEIQAYWKQLSIKHRIEPHIEYGSELISAIWDEQQQHYALTIRDVKTQTMRNVVARVVVTAIGVLTRPRWPNITGIESFNGDILHAEHWDHRVSLSGKRVAVIGNGCAGSQIVPVISEDDTTQVVNFCRTPSWYLPRPQTRVSEQWKWTFRNVPFALKLFRWYLAASGEVLYQNMKNTPLGNMIRGQLENVAIGHIKQTAPSKYHDQMIPKYSLGCKRVIFDPDYLASLNRPNVDMEWDPIAEIVPDGIITKSGKTHAFDVISFATGFNIEDSLTLNVTGVKGQTLEEYYKQQGGPTGYMGTTIPGFPNWITLFGPNTTTGHASVIFALETQSNYAVQLLKPILEGKTKSFVPRAKPTQSWNNWAQNYLSGQHIWSSCASWYRAGSQNGKIVALWPGSTTHMWWSLRKPILKDYKFVGGDEWMRRKRIVELIFWSGTLVLGLAFVWVNMI